MDPLVTVMDFYGAFRKAALNEERSTIFDLDLAEAATALLGSCSHNSQEATQAITRIGQRLLEEGRPWNLWTVHERYREMTFSADARQ